MPRLLLLAACCLLLAISFGLVGARATGDTPPQSQPNDSEIAVSDAPHEEPANRKGRAEQGELSPDEQEQKEEPRREPRPAAYFDSRLLVGGEFTHTVDQPKQLRRIAARYGVPPALLAERNGVEPRTRLQEGAEVRGSNRHLVPETLENGILINLPQRMLFLFREGELVNAWPVAIGRPDAPTIIGDFKVTNLARNPAWIVPESIKAQWRARDRDVVDRVPPGPGNPLGGYWIGLNRPSYGIHGTNAPQEIFSSASQGCVRMHSEDAAELFSQVEKGMLVRIIYQPVLIASLSDGSVYLEIHPDYYNRTKALMREVQLLAHFSGLSYRMDWQQVEQVVSSHKGVAVNVTWSPEPPAAEIARR